VADDVPQNPETLIEFPAELSVKAMGLNDSDFAELVESLVRPHVPDDRSVRITQLESRRAKYISIRAHFTADTIEQLHAISLPTHLGGDASVH